VKKTTEYDFDDSLETNETLKAGLVDGDTFTLFGNKYYILSVGNGTIELGEDHGTEWIKVGQILEFSGYKVEAVDLSIGEEKALFKITTPEGDSEFVTLDLNETEEIDDMRITLEDVFVGVEGSLIAQISVQTDIEEVETGDTAFVDDYEVTLVTDDSTGTWVLEKIQLTNENDLYGSEIELFDTYVVKYVFKEYSTEYDEEDYYTAKAYVAIDPVGPKWETTEVEIGGKFDDYVIDSVKTEKVKTIEITEITEPITVLDEEVDLNAVDSNLILVGGPVANAITKYLVEQGLSTVDWENSDGEFEYLEDVFGEYDVLIVAGKDRYATREAAKELMQYLAAL